MKCNSTIVKEINEMFPAASEGYPVCFIREGETAVLVTSECYAKEKIGDEWFPVTVYDYYDAPDGWEFGIHPKLHEYAKKLGMYWECEDPSCIVLCDS